MRLLFTAIALALFTTACSADSSKPLATASPSASDTPLGPATTETSAAPEPQFLDVNGRRGPRY